MISLDSPCSLLGAGFVKRLKQSGIRRKKGKRTPEDGLTGAYDARKGCTRRDLISTQF